MKKLSAFIVALFILFAFAACESKKENDKAVETKPELPSAVIDEVKAYFDDLGIKTGDVEEEYQLSESGAVFYVVSGRFEEASTDTGSDDYSADAANFENGYFFGIAYVYDGEAEFASVGTYGEADEENFAGALKKFIDGCKENEDDLMDTLAELAGKKEI